MNANRYVSNLVVHSPLTKITKVTVNGKNINVKTDGLTYSISGISLKRNKARIKVWIK
jgi:hypothetical protein